MNTSNKQNDYITLREIGELFYRRITWFAISIPLCLFIAVIYIVLTPPTYTHQASVLVGSRSKQDNRQAANADAFNDVGLSLFSTNSNAVSELHIFQSPTLMEEVVRRLKLNYDYSISYKLVRDVSLYSNSPIFIQVDSLLDNTNVRFDIELKDENSVVISNFIINDIEMDMSQEVNLYTSTPFPYGNVKVEPSACYGDYIGKSISFSRQNIKPVAKKYLGALTAKLSEDKAPIILLSYNDTHHQRANDVLGTLIEVYNENWISDKNQITVSTSNFIDERLNVIESELGSVDNNISTYKGSRMIPDVEAITNIYLSQASANRTQLISLQNQHSVAQYIHSFMLDSKSKGQLLPSNVGVENANINTQIERYNLQLLEKNKLVSSSSEENPLVVNMSNSLEMMKTAIVRSVNEYISTLNIQIENISKEEKQTNTKLQMNPSEAKYLLSEERKQKVKEGLYLFLLQQREQNELSQTFTAYNTKVVNQPDMSNLPTTPRKSIILVVAFLLGLIIPALIIWMQEKLDTLVRTREDLESLSVPFAGEIPLMKQNKQGIRVKQKKSSESLCPILVVEDKSRNVINEAFRNIRTNVDFMKPKQDVGVVVMNSSLFPASGKTFFISNLSLAMGIKGSKVLVVDADLRKSTLSKLVSSSSKGLAEYLSGDTQHIDECIVSKTMHPNVDILPTGVMPPNPTELLLSDRFGELIIQLRQKYDYIFLDCPPTEIVTDSSIISKFCDMTLFVIRANVFDKRMLAEIETIYKNKTYKGLALILNGVEYNKNNKYGYGKYGNARYGGYYSNDK